MERCVFNVYTNDFTLESARQSMKPCAEADKVCSLCCAKHVSEISTLR
jgi:hypothetical protein